MRRLMMTAALMSAATSATGAAQARFVRPITLTESEEVALARSAAPSGIGDSAAVYVLGSSGYVRVREGSNGFTCLVEHEDPKAVEPVCYDSVGTMTLLPVALYRQSRRAAGEPDSLIERAIADGFARRRFAVPPRTSVAYMLSPQASIPPHVMVYAPYATRRQLGLPAPGKGGGLPILYNESKPNAAIVILVRRPQDSAPGAPEIPP